MAEMPRAAAAALACLVAAGAIFALSPEEMERYGFSPQVTTAVQRMQPVRLTAAPRRVPPPPILPRPRQELPAALIPAPTRPGYKLNLRPNGQPVTPARKASVVAPGPVLDAELAEIFPDQTRTPYAGDEQCLRCHGEKGHDQPHSLYGLIKNTESVPAERRGCEGCHGPGADHVATSGGAIVNPVKLDHLAISRLCLSCHEDRRAVRRQEWHVTGHQEAFISCTSCHSVHHAKARGSLAKEPDRLCLSCHQDQAIKFKMRSRHPVKMEGSEARASQREGKVRCIDCHQVYSARHGNDQLRREGKELCTKCHAETRGPFVFEHDAASGETGHQCSSCHMAHGSPNRDLLIVQGRPLCLRCHTDRVSHRPGPTCYTAQCHRDIHGSNLNQLFLPR